VETIAAGMGEALEVEAKMGASTFALECEVLAMSAPPTNVAPKRAAVDVQILNFLPVFITTCLLRFLECFEQLRYRVC
jgi:hypothetical protein